MEYVGYMGFGALLLALIQHLLARRDKGLDRQAQEKKEAYTGLLNALFALRQNEQLTESKVDLLYWVARVQLVCSQEIVFILIDIEGSKMEYLTTKMKVDNLVFAMRNDLGIA